MCRKKKPKVCSGSFKKSKLNAKTDLCSKGEVLHLSSPSLNSSTPFLQYKKVNVRKKLKCLGKFGLENLSEVMLNLMLYSKKLENYNTK